ncbi:hypothetical protein PA598K_01357 [Paenibacillus sp. 598K]|uniref:hypothetical protein n=1 Tax=Paenibacillus sp. 598K TaxID=1117987 RepID=UPI000FF96A86|nr:hypothetical protein [Paenibacillus sp. 598K]GBF73072.1 hypothetical protein PA598K_01357 [Paenibacillus sp. 598K]
MNRAETGQLFDEIISYYPSYERRVSADPEGMIDKWQAVLQHTPLDFAIAKLKEYASLPDNRFAPHPGALAKVKTELERYYEQQQAAGAVTLEMWDDMRRKAVPPTEEQRRKVEELRGR